MDYFFPSAIKSITRQHEVLSALEITVNSGTNALRLLLRSFALPKGSKVAIPAFVCSSVKEAVEAEKLSPLVLDLKPDTSFWTFFDLDMIRVQEAKVIILVHLYGFIHPDTCEIIDFCNKNNIKLIQDAAQSYGVDEQLLLKGNGIIYSFGPGKSSTAAGGAWVKIVEKEKYPSVKKSTFLYFQNARAELFLKSRMLGYHCSKLDIMMHLLLSKFNYGKNEVFSMSVFQLKMASSLISNLKIINLERKKRYFCLLEKIKQNPLLNIPYDDGRGLYFKMILQVNSEVGKLKSFLKRHKIPYFCLHDTIEHLELQNFMKFAPGIIEFSCESCIPENEIERIAVLLGNYK
jgi:dTDP-4-amino-4,6-dideoxygalactose transaminase